MTALTLAMAFAPFLQIPDSPVPQNYFGISTAATPAGAVVLMVAPESPAARANLRIGDIIASIDGAITKDNSVVPTLAGKEIGKPVKLGIKRGEQSLVVEVTPTLRPTNRSAYKPLQDPDFSDVDRPDWNFFQRNGDLRGINPGMMPPAMNVPRPMLGITVQSPDPALRQKYKLTDQQGALVLEVRPNTPASEAGLQPGDLVQAINEFAINDAATLQQMVGMSKEGQKLKLKVLRDGKTVEPTVTVKVMTAPTGATIPIPGATPTPGIAPNSADSGDIIQNLRRQIEALERRVQQLESKMSPNDAGRAKPRLDPEPQPPGAAK